MAHINNFLAIPSTEVACVRDVDSRAMDKGLKAVGQRQEIKPKGVGDFRRILEGLEISVLSIPLLE